METIRHRVGIQASPAEVRAKVATIDGLATWWTPKVIGDPGIGGELQFTFDGPDPAMVAEVAESTERRVAWHCVDGPDAWTGGTIAFEIEPTADETVLKFTQTWHDGADFMSHCSTKWAYFLLGMKASLEGGTATPYPTDLKISSWG